MQFQLVRKFMSDLSFFFLIQSQSLFEIINWFCSSDYYLFFSIQFIIQFLGIQYESIVNALIGGCLAPCFAEHWHSGVYQLQEFPYFFVIFIILLCTWCWRLPTEENQQADRFGTSQFIKFHLMQPTHFASVVTLIAQKCIYSRNSLLIFRPKIVFFFSLFVLRFFWTLKIDGVFMVNIWNMLLHGPNYYKEMWTRKGGRASGFDSRATCRRRV